MRPDTVREEGEFRERLHEVLVAFGGRLKGRDRELFDQRLMTDEPQARCRSSATRSASAASARVSSRCA